MITKNNKYDHKQVYVDFEHVNAHGQPALKCVDTKKWIQWISKKDLPLICRIELDENKHTC
jgi:uncharacterized Zn-finger protein